MVIYYLEMDKPFIATQHLPYEHAAMPVTGMSVTYPDGWIIPAHSHLRGQLLYAVEGVMTIESLHGRWIVPPSRGVWIIAGEQHAVRMHGNVAMKTLFINTNASAELPTSTCVLDIQPLLKALIIAISETSLEYAKNSREDRIAQLILDEIRIHPSLPLHLPWPENKQLQMLCRQMIQELSEQKSSMDWARQLNVSAKSFHRYFKKETGITFGQWREQARMLKALEGIAKGEKLLHVAIESGYQSQSAFSAVFKKHFGLPPSAYYA